MKRPPTPPVEIVVEKVVEKVVEEVVEVVAEIVIEKPDLELEPPQLLKGIKCPDLP